MVHLDQTVAESVDFTVGMREAVGSNVGDAISKQDRFDASLRVGCIVGAAVGALGLGVGEGVPCTDVSMGLAVPTSLCPTLRVSSTIRASENAIKTRATLSIPTTWGVSRRAGRVRRGASMRH
jgi:hypothetical protein